MKQKLALLLAAKLHIWSSLCQPFTGETAPEDPHLAAQCSKAQVNLDRVVHRLNLIEAVRSGHDGLQRSQQEK